MAALATQLQFDRFGKAVERQAAKDVLTRNAPPVAARWYLILGIVATGSCLLYCLNNSKFRCWIARQVAFIKPTAKKITKTRMLLNELDATIDASHLKFIANKPTDTVESTFVCMLHVWNCSTSYPTIYPVAKNVRFYSCTKDNPVNMF